MKLLARLLLSVMLVTCSVGCDQATKHVATQTLRGQAPRSYAADLVRLEYIHNPGSFLGLGGTLPESARYALFVAGVGLFLLAVAAYLVVSRAPTVQTVVGASLLLGGGLSNWIDRVRAGSVVDFLNVGIGALRTGIFNFADLILEAGVLLLLLDVLGRGNGQPPPHRRLTRGPNRTPWRR